MRNGTKNRSANADRESVTLWPKAKVDTKFQSPELLKLVEETNGEASRRWAEFRLAVVGHLIFNEVERGQLTAKLKSLSEMEWKNPISGKSVSFSYSTIENWYYRVFNNPETRFGSLFKRRRDAGFHRSLTKQVRHFLTKQAQKRPSWTYSRHHKELVKHITLHGWGQPPGFLTDEVFHSA